MRECEPLIARLLGATIELEMEIKPSGRVLADPGQIEQVLLNLAANARDAMKGGGKFTIRVQSAETAAGTDDEAAAKRGEFALLSVADSGSGMAPEILDKIFEPFFTTKARDKGTGLGLATVHAIVTQNGGAIDVRSEIGKGSTFVIHLPLVREAAPEGKGPRKAEPVEEAAGSILLAEDDEGARALVQMLLSNAGYEVQSAADGRAAADIFAESPERFDLILTDVVMPRMSGPELAEEAHRIRPEIPILFMSGYLDEHIPGADGLAASKDLLLKPFTRSELLDALAGARA